MVGLTGVLISSDCSRIRFLLKRHKKSVTTYCLRASNNRSVTLNKNCILKQSDDMAMPVSSTMTVQSFIAMA